LKPEADHLVAQRNRAIACAAIAIVISLSLVISTFLSHRRNLAEANREIQDLQKQLIATQDALKANEAELLKLQSELLRAQKISSGKPSGSN
jgi:hypothetical protein